MGDFGIIHCDVKPENILVTGRKLTLKDRRSGESYEVPEVKLGDLGLANLVIGSKLATRVCGSRSYMAPEMLRGEAYRESVDIFSLGVVMYELLYGCPPFSADCPTVLKS